MSVRIRSATHADADTILHLLQQSSLPTDGIVGRVDTTLVAHSGTTPVGTAALEIYPSAALLRSVAVDAAARTTGVGTALTMETLSLARRLGVKTVVLLTTTAELFFARFGFERITRDLVPRELRESVEFTSACPASAIAMRLDVEFGVGEHVEVCRERFVISTDPSRLDIALVHSFLSSSYWARGISKRTVERSIRHSLCFGLYDGREQIGFARVITDRATYGYLSDVFVAEPHRGKGLGKWLMEVIVGHPALRNLRRFALDTRDAHGLYRQFGFAPSFDPDRHMEMARGGRTHAKQPAG